MLGPVRPEQYGLTVPFLVLVLAVAVAVALATGGHLGRVADREWHWPVLVFAALAVQALIEVGPSFPRSSNVGLVLLLVSYVMLLAFCAVNLRHRGLAVVAVGIALNAIVIAADRGMPAKAPGDARVAATIKHHPLSDRDHLTGFGDVIVVRPLHQAVSLGDIFMAGGLISVLVHASRPRRKLTAHDRHLMRLHDDAMRRLEDVGLRSPDSQAAGAQAVTSSSAASTRGS
jgi:hypothetical protein